MCIQFVVTIFECWKQLNKQTQKSTHTSKSAEQKHVACIIFVKYHITTNAPHRMQFKNRKVCVPTNKYIYIYIWKSCNHTKNKIPTINSTKPPLQSPTSGEIPAPLTLHLLLKSWMSALPSNWK